MQQLLESNTKLAVWSAYDEPQCRAGGSGALMDVRILPATQPRVETGAVQFGDDWPGTFIRGDNAAHYAMHLQALLKAHAGRYTDPIAECVVRGLLSDLHGSNISPPRDCRPPERTHEQLSAEQAFVDRYDHYIAKRVARELWRSQHHGGMQAGMPQVTLDSATVENLLSRWLKAGGGCNLNTTSTAPCIQR